jgi:hypothetical protein
MDSLNPVERNRICEELIKRWIDALERVPSYFGIDFSNGCAADTSFSVQEHFNEPSYSMV